MTDFWDVTILSSNVNICARILPIFDTQNEVNFYKYGKDMSVNIKPL